jgi:hypothetical protein
MALDRVSVNSLLDSSSSVAGRHVFVVTSRKPFFPLPATFAFATNCPNGRPELSYADRVLELVFAPSPMVLSAGRMDATAELAAVGVDPEGEGMSPPEADKELGTVVADITPEADMSASEAKGAP